MIPILLGATLGSVFAAACTVSRIEKMLREFLHGREAGE